MQTVATRSLISASRSLASTQTNLYKFVARYERSVIVVIRRFGVREPTLVTCFQQCLQWQAREIFYKLLDYLFTDLGT